MFIDDDIIETTDEDFYLKIRYSYVVSLKKLDSFTKELLKFNYDENLLIYIKNFISEINDTIYAKEIKKKTLLFEKEFLNSNNFINLEIIFYAFDRLMKKEPIKKEVTDKIISLRKQKVLKMLESKKSITKLDYQKIINKLDTISLILFIDYAINNIENKSDF